MFSAKSLLLLWEKLHCCIVCCTCPPIHRTDDKLQCCFSQLSFLVKSCTLSGVFLSEGLGFQVSGFVCDMFTVESGNRFSYSSEIYSI